MITGGKWIHKVHRTLMWEMYIVDDSIVGEVFQSPIMQGKYIARHVSRESNRWHEATCTSYAEAKEVVEKAFDDSIESIEVGDILYADDYIYVVTGFIIMNDGTRTVMTHTLHWNERQGYVNAFERVLDNEDIVGVRKAGNIIDAVKADRIHNMSNY